MYIAKKIALGLALAASITAPAMAGTITQSTAPANWDSSGWHWQALGSVTLDQNTTEIVDFTTSAQVWDQGWGGEDQGGNQLFVGLFDNGTQLWGQHVAGGGHFTGGYTQTYDLASNAAAWTGLNQALDTINWGSGDNITMKLMVSTIGYPGWELHARNATMTVTADVPEPASVALFGLGLAGFAAARRKSKKN